MFHCPSLTLALFCSTVGQVTVQTVAIHNRSPSKPDGVALLNTSEAGSKALCFLFVCFVVGFVCLFFNFLKQKC